MLSCSHALMLAAIAVSNVASAEEYSTLSSEVLDYLPEAELREDEVEARVTQVAPSEWLRDLRIGPGSETWVPERLEVHLPESPVVRVDGIVHEIDRDGHLLLRGKATAQGEASHTSDFLMLVAPNGVVMGQFTLRGEGVEILGHQSDLLSLRRFRLDDEWEREWYEREAEEMWEHEVVEPDGGTPEPVPEEERQDAGDTGDTAQIGDTTHTGTATNTTDTGGFGGSDRRESVIPMVEDFDAYNGIVLGLAIIHTTGATKVLKGDYCATRMI